MLALILSRPLTSALAALALLGLVLGGVQTWRASRLKGELSEAKAAELGAKIQATLSDKVLKIEDRRHTIETRIIEVGHDEAAALREDVRGSSPVDPGLLADWRRALGRVREAGAGPDDTRAGEPSGSVSAP